MDAMIVADALFVMLNLPFYLDMPDEVKQPSDGSKRLSEEKLRNLFYFCVLPFLVAKVLLRFWPFSKPVLQAERFCAVQDFQFFAMLMFQLFERTNCEIGTVRKFELLCNDVLPRPKTTASLDF